MKTAIAILLCCTLMACHDSNELAKRKLVGKWELIETLMDPGDGSGVFREASYEWRIEFKNHGTVQSSLGLCLDGTIKSGTYTDNEVSGLNCDPVYRYWFEGEFLILAHKYCFEPCQYKFVKANAVEDF